MVWLLSMFIDIFSAAIILIPAIIILQNILFKGTPFKHRVLTIVFAIYLTAVFSVVGFPSINTLTIDLNFNIVPIISMFSGLKTTILNILLFIPLGILLPLIWNNFRSTKGTVLLGLGLSLVIEILQIFTLRATDIDDLITNTIGTLLGYLIAKFINSKCANKLYLKDETIHGNKELFCVCGVTILIVFLIAPFISSPLWELFYMV